MQLASKCTCSDSKVFHLCGSNEDFSVLGSAQVVHHAHEMQCLSSGLLSLWHMQVHFISIEVSVVGAAHALIEAQCPAQHKLMLQLRLIKQALLTV